MITKKIVEFFSVDSVYNYNLTNALEHCSTHTSFKVDTINNYQIWEDFLSEKNIKYAQLSRFKKICVWRKYAKYLKGLDNKEEKKAVIHLHYIRIEYSLLLDFFVSHYDEIILSFWGSDLLRHSKYKLKILIPLIKRSSKITFETEEMKTAFCSIFGNQYNEKIRIVRWGLPVINEIKDLSEHDINKFYEKFHLDKNKIIVTIGYSRIRAHQHIEVVKGILEYRNLYNDIFLIFPWTYGYNDPGYKEEIENIICEKIQYTFIGNRMTNREVACLRKATDYFVHVETTDSLSASLLEAIYAENIVITGSWLNYGLLYRNGIKLLQVDAPIMVGDVMEKEIKRETKIINNEILKNNASSVQIFCDWNMTIDDWKQLYDLGK